MFESIIGVTIAVMNVKSNTRMMILMKDDDGFTDIHVSSANAMAGGDNANDDASQLRINLTATCIRDARYIYIYISINNNIIYHANCS